MSFVSFLAGKSARSLPLRGAAARNQFATSWNFHTDFDHLPRTERLRLRQLII
jgi:hypothetical protein